MMMSSSNSSSSSGRNQIQFSTSSPSPFTAIQYEELEHQALIYKYLASGVPIPPNLLSSVKPTSFYFSNPSTTLQSTMGWGCFQVGFGSKKVDPEPGRCRRTDGKKWRCSKEAYLDSKYCEKHMHRGKNRSKNKPLSLEVLTTSTISTTSSSSSLSSTPSISTLSQNYSIPTISDYTNAYSNYYQSNSFYPFLSPHSSMATTPSSGLILGSSSGNMGDKDSRYWSGMKEDVGERSFFPEASRTMKGLAYDSYAAPSAMPLTMSSQSEYSHLPQYQCYNIITDEHSIREEDDQHQRQEEDHNAPNSRASNNSNSNNGKNPFHHFFSEWPVKNNTDSWLEDHQDVGEEGRDRSHHHHTVSASTTQLSISIPPHSFW